MTWFMLPAILGILVKLYLLLSSTRRKWISGGLVGLVSILALHNFSELLLFNGFVRHLNAEYLMRAYYLCAISVSTYAFWYSYKGDRTRSKKLPATVILIALLLSFAVTTSDFVIAGAASLTYSVTAVKGDYYWFFQVFSLVASLGTLTYLVLNYLRSESASEQIRNFYALVSMVPLVITGVAIICLMSLGVKINATFVFPIASTLFLIILIKGKYSESLINDPRSFIPFSAEGQLNSSMKASNLLYRIGEIDHKMHMADLEKSTILYMLSKNKGNISKTAASMKINRTTLYGKFKTLGIDHTTYSK